jgi:hypothetical protein
MKHFQVPIDVHAGGYVLETHRSFSLVKQYLEDHFFNYLDAGGTIWFWDTQLQGYKWLTTATATWVPRDYSEDNGYARLSSGRYELADGQLRAYEHLAPTAYCHFYDRSDKEQLAKEDPTQILRYASAYDHTPEELPFHMALRANALEFNCELVPPEVIHQYLQYEFNHARFAVTKCLQLLGVLDQFVPELAENDGCEQDPEYHTDDVLTHLMKSAKLTKSRSLTRICTEHVPDLRELDRLYLDNNRVLALAALCHDIGKAATREENA